MPSQIFKANVPNLYLLRFLQKNCDKLGNIYMFNNEAYKRATLNDSIEDFKKHILEYYHLSKRNYVTRKQSFVRMATIIRQICKHNALSHTSKIKYRSAGYDITYYISMAECENNLDKYDSYDTTDSDDSCESDDTS